MFSNEDDRTDSTAAFDLTGIIPGRMLLLLSMEIASFPRDLKPLDTFGKQCCQRPTLRVSQLTYKSTNL